MTTDGQTGARRIIYFHGVPGSPRELELFGAQRLLSGAWAPDRNTDRPELGYADYFDVLAQRLNACSPPGGFHFVGFSLGTAAALQVAHRLGSTVKRIDLISAAAPLELGAFFPSMAGRQVFEVAARRPKLFSALTAMQSLLSRWAPDVLVQMLMATAQGADQNLARDKAFRASLAAIVASALADGAPGYRREILGYVRPWAPILSAITVPVRLWHGTMDTWSPIAMADSLQAAAPETRFVERLEGLSHYSALRTAMEKIENASQDRE